MNIGAALSVGYTIAQAIGFLTDNFPKIGRKIKEAKKLGYDVEQIVKSFSNMSPEDLKRYENSKQLDTDNPWISAAETQRERSAAVKGKEHLIKGAKLAAIPLAAYGLQRYLNKAVQPSEILEGYNELPAPDETLQLEQMPPETPSPTPTPQPQEPIQPGPNVGQQVGGQAASPVTQAMQPTSPNQMQGAAQAMPNAQPQPIFEQLLGGVDPNTLESEKQQQLKFLAMISDQLQTKGKTLNDPEFKNLAKKIKNVIGGKPDMITEENARFQAGQEAKQKPMTKGAEVITPNGDFATVEDHPGKAAKVMVDGKPKVFDADELTPIPENHEEIGTLYQQLIDKIPEGQKSRVYDAIGYDPNRNAIKYTYHDGKSYIIDDVPEEIVKEITNSGYLAKTSGGNYMGFYYKGNPSIGAGMHVLISDLQRLRGGKGKEYSYKFEELYSQHRLPKNALKEKHEREKAREREEKKAKKKRSST